MAGRSLQRQKKALSKSYSDSDSDSIKAVKSQDIKPQSSWIWDHYEHLNNCSNTLIVEKFTEIKPKNKECLFTLEYTTLRTVKKLHCQHWSRLCHWAESRRHAVDSFFVWSAYKCAHCHKFRARGRSLQSNDITHSLSSLKSIMFTGAKNLIRAQKGSQSRP
jgi:hypothetical protein